MILLETVDKGEYRRIFYGHGTNFADGKRLIEVCNHLSSELDIDLACSKNDRNLPSAKKRSQAKPTLNCKPGFEASELSDQSGAGRTIRGFASALFVVIGGVGADRPTGIFAKRSRDAVEKKRRRVRKLCGVVFEVRRVIRLHRIPSVASAEADLRSLFS